MNYYKEKQTKKDKLKNPSYIFYCVSHYGKKTEMVDTGDIPRIGFVDYLSLPNLIVCTQEEYTNAKNKTIERINLINARTAEFQNEGNGAFAGTTPSREVPLNELEIMELTDSYNEVCRGVRVLEKDIENLEVDKVLLNKTIKKLTNDILEERNQVLIATSLLGKEKVINERRKIEIQILNNRISELTDDNERVIKERETTLSLATKLYNRVTTQIFENLLDEEAELLKQIESDDLAF